MGRQLASHIITLVCDMNYITSLTIAIIINEYTKTSQTFTTLGWDLVSTQRLFILILQMFLSYTISFLSL